MVIIAQNLGPQRTQRARRETRISYGQWSCHLIAVACGSITYRRLEDFSVLSVVQDLDVDSGDEARMPAQSKRPEEVRPCQRNTRPSSALSRTTRRAALK